MALRLELRQTAGPGAERGRRSWVLERGRRTLGRSESCDWHIEDTGRTISKTHCTIEADRSGFVLRDESANGSKVDGRALQEGETAPLTDGARVELGGFVFEVSIKGERDVDFGDPADDLVLGDDNLTISSILADVAPASTRQHGLTGSDAWRDMQETRESGRPSRRNVEIGWSGPPEPDGIRPILPDNWFEESDQLNAYEHGRATHVSVPRLRNAAARDEAPTSGYSEDPFAEAAPGAETEPDPAPVFVAADIASAPEKGADLRQVEVLAARCEEACADLFSAFDLDMGSLVPAPDLPGVTREDAVRHRLETVLRAQRALKTALDRMVGEASHALEPRIVEAQVDAEVRRISSLPLLRDRSYWQAYKARFEKDGRQLSVRDVLREAMLNSLAKSDDKANEVDPGT